MEEQELTVEKELLARIFAHKTTLLMTKIANEYVKEQTKGTIQIPLFQLQEQAVEIANKQVQNYLLAGKLDEEYNNAWENIKEVIPDNYSILM